MAKNKYTEPAEYFPKEIRKKFKIGEFYEEPKDDKEQREKENKAFRDFVNKK